MLSFKEYLMEMPWRKISDLNPMQEYPTHVDTGWVEYLRKHLRSKKSEAVFKKRNPHFVNDDGDKVAVDAERKSEGSYALKHTKLWDPIVTTTPYNDSLSGKQVQSVLNGHHRFYAKKFEGKKRIKTDK